MMMTRVAGMILRRPAGMSWRVLSTHTSEGSSTYHLPVMLKECINYLNIQPNGLYIDCTLGGGGHTSAILKAGGRVIAIDQDPDAIKSSSERLQSYLEAGSLEICRSNFRNIRHVLADSRIANGGKADGILMDLGISSYQIDADSRGFSFSGNGPLDMRMHRGTSDDTDDRDFNASTIVNNFKADELADVLYYYGEERRSRQIAREIISHRPIDTTDHLQQVISRITSFKDRPKVLARCFQAIRIAVNDELNALDDALLDAAHCLKFGGRLVVLSYHSLEDRRVKNLMKTGNPISDDVPSSLSFERRLPHLRRRQWGDDRTDQAGAGCPWRLLEKRPVPPSDEEVAENRRSRSAKLRAAERVDPNAIVEVKDNTPHIGAKQARKLAMMGP